MSNEQRPSDKKEEEKQDVGQSDESAEELFEGEDSEDSSESEPANQSESLEDSDEPQDHADPPERKIAPQPPKSSELQDFEESLESSEDQEEDEQEENEDHPLDRLSESIDKIEKQLVRLENRNAGNLKFELVNNVYPILFDALRAIYVWMSDVEDDLSAEQSDETSNEAEEGAEEFQRSIKEESLKVIAVCDKIISSKETGAMSEEDWQQVVDWAEETKRKVTPVTEEM